MTVHHDIDPVALTADNIDTIALTLLEAAERGMAVTLAFSRAEAPPALFPVPDCGPDTDAPAPEPADEPDTILKLGRGPLLAATAKLDIRWSAGGYAWISNDEVCGQQAEDYWLANRAELEASCNWASKFTNTALMNRAAVAAAHLRFSRVNGNESAEAFLRPIGTFVGLAEDTGQLTLVKKLSAHVAAVAKGKTDKHVSNEDVLTMLTRLYVKHLRGKTVTKIGWPEDWTTPAIPRVR